MKIYHELPHERPHTPLLDTINSPHDLRALDDDHLEVLCDELRAFLLWSTNRSGGHFGSNLGTVELTVALHATFDTPNDLLVWDVGHQAYPHKVLTGRREAMPSIRSADGPAPFLLREESEYDVFGAGHSSTSISAAIGLAYAARAAKEERRVCAIIGDGGITAGMAFEALNHIGHVKLPMVIVLNDNDMSISHNIGALTNYFARIWASKSYMTLRSGGKHVLEHLPRGLHFARQVGRTVRKHTVPGALFEEMGIRYVGPIDGHDVAQVMQTMRAVHERSGPWLVHCITHKGKGFASAEAERITHHAIPKAQKSKPVTQPTYSSVFGSWVTERANHDPTIEVITPAMCEGSGLLEYFQKHPTRAHDVAIAEQHAVTLGAAMGIGGRTPIVAIYSTFMQRAYDQVVHDAALQRARLVLAIDRGGLVGEDGPTHHGLYDMATLRVLPDIEILAPSSREELIQALEYAVDGDGVIAVRYPRGEAHAQTGAVTPMKQGEARVVRMPSPGQPCLLNFGTLLQTADKVAEATGSGLVDMRFVKPLDESLLTEIAGTCPIVGTLEDGIASGGAGSAVLEFYADLAGQGHAVPRLIRFGIPDAIIPHGSRDFQLKQSGLDETAITEAFQQAITRPNAPFVNV